MNTNKYNYVAAKGTKKQSALVRVRVSVYPCLSYGFTLAEVLIVVAVLGIIAAIIVPEYRGYTQKAKESAAKENLQILRTAIERYAVQHNGIPPGYALVTGLGTVYDTAFKLQILKGNYLMSFPENPFNNKTTILAIQDDDEFPSEATGGYGWVYQAGTKTMKLDWPGTDSQGMRYFDY